MPEDDVYLPLHVGKYGKGDLGYQGDDTGDNISYKNPNYCELTGLYWAWKNLECDYIGLCHYRRYFSNAQFSISINAKKENILKKKDYENILADVPIIVPKKRRYYIETTQSHYEHAHYSDDLQQVKKLIYELYPSYIPYFENVMKRTWGHRFNMFVMRKDYYDEYCEWLFRLLFALEKKININKYDSYQARVYGFIAERMLDIWIEKNEVKYKEQTIVFLENQNWIKKCAKFIYRKIVN